MGRVRHSFSDGGLPSTIHSPPSYHYRNTMSRTIHRIRFPRDFVLKPTRRGIFRISQIVTSSDSSRPQTVTLKWGKNLKYHPDLLLRRGAPPALGGNDRLNSHLQPARCLLLLFAHAIVMEQNLSPPDPV